MEHSAEPTLLWPFLVYSIALISLVAGILLISYFLGERHEEHATDEPYEAGIITTGTSRLRFPMHFYIIAMFFVIFDVETVFIISWAISIREVGWEGYFAVLIFTVVLSVSLIYVWKIGALDFGPNGKKILTAYYKNIKTDPYDEMGK